MILGTEVNEFVSNRQQSKIHFLLQENNQLQEYIQDLENALRLNKQVMKITVENYTQVRKKGLSTSSDLSTSSSDARQQLDKYEILLKHLNEENSNLIETLAKIQKTTTTTTTKALLQEQIAHEDQNFYKDIIQDLEDKLIELKRNIHDKEYAIQELERMKPMLEKEGQVVKIIEVVTPSESTLKMHEELENIRQVLNKITSEAQTISEQNKILREVNYNLKREVYKLRIVLRSQVAHHIMKDFVYNEYIERTDQNLQLNYEIQSHRGKLEQLHQDMFGQGSLGYGFSPEPQQLKYLSKNERMIYQEKLHKMELMLKGFRELFEKEKFINYQTAIKYNEIIQQTDNLNDTNELLIKSNLIKDDRIKKMQNEQQFLKKQLNQFMEIIKTRRHNYNSSVHLQQGQDIAVGLFSPRQSTKMSIMSPKKLFQAQKPPKESLDIDLNKDFLSALNDHTPQSERRSKDQSDTKIKDIEPSNSKLTKKPILKQLIIEEPFEKNDDKNFCYTQRGAVGGVKKKFDVVNLYYDMNLNECKEFLVNMALEFNKSYAFQISNTQKILLMNQIADFPEEVRRVKRSNSDPFGYFSKEYEEEVIAYKRPPKVSVLNFLKSEIHVILEEIEQKKLIRQHPNDIPFNLDVSHIQDSKQQQQQQEPQSSRNQKKNVFVDAELSFISKEEDEEQDEQYQEEYDQDN